jgi:P27 family predicted phage terminase small subunit
MGARGPSAAAPALKLLNGRGNGLDSGGRAVPQVPKFVREAPEPPSWLSDEALAEWRRVVPGLERLDLVKPEDRSTLALYCETWATWVEALAVVRAEGVTVVNPKSGRQGKHPAQSVVEIAGAQLRTFAHEFGLSPSAENNVGKAPASDGGSEENPFSAAQ